MRGPRRRDAPTSSRTARPCPGGEAGHGLVGRGPTDIDYEALVVKRNTSRRFATLAGFGILEAHGDGTMPSTGPTPDGPTAATAAAGHNPGLPAHETPPPQRRGNHAANTGAPAAAAAPCARRESAYGNFTAKGDISELL